MIKRCVEFEISQTPAKIWDQLPEGKSLPEIRKWLQELQAETEGDPHNPLHKPNSARYR